MAAYRRIYDSRYPQADCQEPGSAPEPYAREWSMGYLLITKSNEGAVESQNYVRKRLTKKECFKTLTEDGQRRR